MKCDICKEKVETTFLNKPIGTYLGSGKKKKLVCKTCQKSNSIKQIKEKLGLK